MSSFFGFDTTLDHDAQRLSHDEDLAVYTFGEEGYDDLAAQLDENLDDLNDETFGDMGALCTYINTQI
jgi:DNA topoisomerase 2-associated protein PAT1